MEYIHNINDSQRKLLHLKDSDSNIEVLKEFCSKEAVIKLEGKAFKDFLDIDLNKYKFNSYVEDNYLIVVAY